MCSTRVAACSHYAVIFVRWLRRPNAYFFWSLSLRPWSKWLSQCYGGAYLSKPAMDPKNRLSRCVHTPYLVLSYQWYVLPRISREQVGVSEFLCPFPLSLHAISLPRSSAAGGRTCMAHLVCTGLLISFLKTWHHSLLVVLVVCPRQLHLLRS